MVTDRCSRAPTDRRSEKPGAVEPRFAAALASFEVKLLQDLLDCGQNRALQHPQIRLLPRIDIEQDQFGQRSPGLVDEILVSSSATHPRRRGATVLRVDQVAESSHR